jgi:hypothetical protein
MWVVAGGSKLGVGYVMGELRRGLHEGVEGGIVVGNCSRSGVVKVEDKLPEAGKGNENGWF